MRLRGALKNKMPAFFISHGAGPCFWVDWGGPNPFKGLELFFERIPSLLPSIPKGVLVISAHWEESDFTIQTNPAPSILYDYYGFPENTYRLEYPALNSETLIQRTISLLEKEGIIINQDANRGYDHGVFVPFLKIFPDARIPITQISLKKGMDPSEHFALGRVLAPLRSEGILIVGSGMSYHNLREINDKERKSDVFDEWLTKTLVGPKKERENKLKFWEKAPNARFCHPREEHLIPLMVVAGCAEEDQGEKVFSERMVNWNFMSSSFKFE